MAGDVLQFGRDILHDEARALDALADSLGGAFENAVDLIIQCRGKLIVSGLGKSGHVARKIAAFVDMLKRGETIHPQGKRSSTGRTR